MEKVKNVVLLKDNRNLERNVHREVVGPIHKIRNYSFQLHQFVTNADRFHVNGRECLVLHFWQGFLLAMILAL